MCTAVAGPPVSRPPLDLTLFGCSLQFQKILESPSPEQQVTPSNDAREDQRDGWVVTGLGRTGLGAGVPSPGGTARDRDPVGENRVFQSESWLRHDLTTQ